MIVVSHYKEVCNKKTGCRSLKISCRLLANVKNGRWWLVIRFYIWTEAQFLVGDRCNWQYRSETKYLTVHRLYFLTQVNRLHFKYSKIHLNSASSEGLPRGVCWGDM